MTEIKWHVKTPWDAETQARDVLNKLYSKPYPGSHAYTHAADAIAVAIREARAAGAAEMQKRAVDVCRERAEFEGRMAAKFGNYTTEAHETRQDEASSLSSAIAALPTSPVGRPHAARPADGGAVDDKAKG